jgi:hypothetical protein
MARGYSSEPRTTYLYKTNEGDPMDHKAHLALAAGNLRKSDTPIHAVSPLMISVLDDYCAVC